MSQGDNVVINELERALSTDINNLQSVERSRRLFDLSTINARYGMVEGIASPSQVYFDNGVGALPINGVIGNGLPVAVASGSFSTTFTIGAGTLVRFVQGDGPSIEDANLFQVGRLRAPLENVGPGGAYGGSPVPAAAPFSWLLCARILNNVTVSRPVERFVPATQQFETVNLAKLREGELEFQFFDLDFPNPIPYPGDEWQPLWIISANFGAITLTQDVRQHADGLGANSVLDQNSVRWQAGTTNSSSVISGLEYKFDGRTQGFVGAIPFAQIAQQGLTLAENEVYSLVTYYMRRQDGTLFRPPRPGNGGYGGANAMLVDTSLMNGQYNNQAIPISPNDVWANWYAAPQVDPGYAFWLGNVATRVLAPAAFHRLSRAGRSITNDEGTALPFYNSRFSNYSFLAIEAAGYIEDQILNADSFNNTILNGARPVAIHWRVQFEYRVTGAQLIAADSATDIDDLQDGRVIIKTATGDGTPEKTIYVGGLPLLPFNIVSPAPANIGENAPGAGECHFWANDTFQQYFLSMGAALQPNVLAPIFETGGSGALGVQAYMVPMEWRF